VYLDHKGSFFAWRSERDGRKNQWIQRELFFIPKK